MIHPQTLRLEAPVEKHHTFFPSPLMLPHSHLCCGKAQLFKGGKAQGQGPELELLLSIFAL